MNQGQSSLTRVRCQKCHVLVSPVLVPIAKRPRIGFELPVTNVVRLAVECEVARSAIELTDSQKTL